MAAILNALSALLDRLVAIFGPAGTAIIVIMIPFLALLWKMHQHRREDRRMESLLKAYDDRIASLEARDLQWRDYVLTRMSVPSREVDQMFGTVAPKPELPPKHQRRKGRKS